jgi:oxygen-dependent protoporphyrinogen oxidase
MEKKRIVILGAGVSGLALAYYLSKHSDQYEITILEKHTRPGGWADTNTSNGYFFENGPRTFLASKSPALLSLIEEIGLEHEMIESDKKARGRWLWIDGVLRKVPIWSFPFFKSLLTEWRVPPSLESDESVWDFACRRFNETVAHHVFDPMCIGIHAGDIRELSIRSCFPTFKHWEDKYGSVTKGFFKAPRYKGPYLIALQKGVGSLVARLVEKVRGKILYGQEVRKLSFSDRGVEVQTQRGVFQADECFSALPCHVLGELLKMPELLNIKLNGTTVVNLGYPQEVLNRKGFGYIVSSKENDEMLGVVFNSNAFPQQSRREKETRLTAKLRRTDLSEAEAIEIALFSIKKHLGIVASPEVTAVVRTAKAFPQMQVGYKNWIESVEKRIEGNYPRLKIAGNYLRGVGVNDCIATAKSVVDNFLSAVPS